MHTKELYLKHLATEFIARNGPHSSQNAEKPGDESPVSLLPPGDDFEWEEFLEQLLAHRAIGALVPLMDDRQRTETQRTWLRDATRDYKRRTMLMLLELERILPALEQAGCQPVVLKGAALATGIYTDPTDRFFIDIDILVTPDSVDTACEVLQQRGYHHQEQGNDPRYYHEYHFHWIMLNEQGMCVEVHWALTMPESIYTFDLMGLRQRAELIPFGQGTMRIPSAQDQVLHTVQQCIAHGFSDLRRILDTALLLPRVTDVPGLIEQARQQNMAIGLWLLLDITKTITGLAIDKGQFSELAPDDRRQRYLAVLRLPEICLEHGIARKFDIIYLLHCLCVPTFSQQCREIWRYLVPGEGALLEMGYRSDQMPGWWRRMTISLSRLRDLVHQVSFLFTRLSRARGTPR